MLNYDYEREKKNDKNTLVFQPLVQDTFSSSETEEEDDDEEIKKIPNKGEILIFFLKLTIILLIS